MLTILGFPLDPNHVCNSVIILNCLAMLCKTF